MLTNLMYGVTYPRSRHRLLRDARTLATLLFFAFAPRAHAQGMDHTTMKMSMQMPPDPLGVPMDRSGSATTWIPDALLLPTQHFAAGSWDLMLHGFVFAQYNKQGGPRGDSQFGSLNWGMFMAGREVAGGRFQLRTMFSVDAATVTNRGYPLLLQSGEAYNGRAIHDRQHPHDFFMEIGATYERALNKHVGLSLYVAPSGEPALGPVAFMHRPSAMDIPTAPLGHHWQDATHVAFGVLTVGLFNNQWKVEGSAFNGREPDQYRWNFDKLALDSYTGRVTFNPNRNWSLTTGYGFLKSPEILHHAESQHRLTSSAMYGRELGEHGQWATTFIFGSNSHGSKATTATEESVSHRSSSFLLETEAIINDTHTIFARTEHVQKTAEDLVLDAPVGSAVSSELLGISSASIGYVRELKKVRGATIGLGAMGTLNFVPSSLEPYYGSRTPVGGVVFLRLRPVFKRGGMNMAMPGMKM